MDRRKPLSQDELDFIGSITSNIDVEELVKLHRKFGDTLSTMRKVIKNFFPTQLRFTVTRDSVKINELRASISLTGYLDDFDFDSPVAEYIYDNLVDIIKFTHDKEEWNNYNLSYDIERSTLSGTMVFKLKGGE